MTKTKADLLEENINLLKSAIKGWSIRLALIAELGGDPSQIENVCEEMNRFTGE